MSETKTRLSDDMKKAMKEGEKDLLGVLRMMINEIRNAEINDLKEPGRLRTEAEVVQILAGYQKQLQKSMAEYPAERQAPLKAALRLWSAICPRHSRVQNLRPLLKIILVKPPSVLLAF